jgi:hypothetical protein
VHGADGTTSIVGDAGALLPMRAPSAEDLEELRAQYFRENTTTDRVDYGVVLYSMNDGDYLAPNL